MGRELRMVPADWKHPKNKDGHFIPLHGYAYTETAKEWDEEYAQWQKGFTQDYSKAGKTWKPKTADLADVSFQDWNGRRPCPTEHMPEWPQEQRTHYMMYEDTSEGTPISPAFATPEELARWLADNKASACGRMTATYDQWLSTIRRGSAISMVIDGAHGLRSGVEASND